MKLPYKEGTWFALPLLDGCFAIGLIARATNKGKVVLGYFFGPVSQIPSNVRELESLNPNESACALRFGDLSLVNGKWKIIGSSESWNRSQWPTPYFVRRDEIARKAWRVTYSDADPNKVVREEPEPFESSLAKDSLLGADALEIVLTRRLKESLK